MDKFLENITSTNLGIFITVVAAAGIVKSAFRCVSYLAYVAECNSAGKRNLKTNEMRYKSLDTKSMTLESMVSAPWYTTESSDSDTTEETK